MAGDVGRRAEPDAWSGSRREQRHRIASRERRQTVPARQGPGVDRLPSGLFDRCGDRAQCLQETQRAALEVESLQVLAVVVLSRDLGIAEVRLDPRTDIESRQVRHERAR